jgi:hypothetical protein
MSHPPVATYSCMAELVLDHLPEAAEFRDGQVVYFVGSDDGPVKIGTTKEPLVRLQRMQAGSPVPLRILAAVPGGAKLEAGYHRAFAHRRLHGEWFQRDKIIEQEIRHWRAKCRRHPCVTE